MADSARARQAPYSVYTILAEETLDALALYGDPIRPLCEKKRWAEGKRLFDEARANGQTMSVLFADAAFDCSKLIYAATPESIELHGDETQYVVSDLRPIRRHRTQELELKSTGKNIAEGYLRPYAIVRTPSFLPAVRSTASGALEIFSFGYDGCGSATRELVAAIDEAEQARGYRPPLWVDTRIRRSGRAAGFRDNTFGRLLGDRYLWMQGLGNTSVVTGEDRIRIQDPPAAEELLDLATGDPSRRVIFFCHCETPVHCHRREVAKLLKRAARARGVPLIVDDWPGGEPGARELEVSRQSLRKVRGGAKRLPVPATMTIADAASIPWGTLVTLRADEQEHLVGTGPARFASSGAYLPILPVATARERDAWRREHGYLPLQLP